MLTRKLLASIVMVGALSYAGVAMGQDKVHSYLNDTALKVKATASAAEKREILSTSLNDMIVTIDKVKSAPLTSAQDDASLDRVKAMLQEKSDELAGLNGFDPVPDDQLNAFSTYIVQDMEQADRSITISLVAALLIVIIIILLV